MARCVALVDGCDCRGLSYRDVADMAACGKVVLVRLGLGTKCLLPFQPHIRVAGARVCISTCAESLRPVRRCTIRCSSRWALASFVVYIFSFLLSLHSCIFVKEVPSDRHSQYGLRAPSAITPVGVSSVQPHAPPPEHLDFTLVDRSSPRMQAEQKRHAFVHAHNAFSRRYCTYASLAPVPTPDSSSPYRPSLQPPSTNLLLQLLLRRECDELLQLPHVVGRAEPLPKVGRHDAVHRRRWGSAREGAIGGGDGPSGCCCFRRPSGCGRPVRRGPRGPTSVPLGR